MNEYRINIRKPMDTGGGEPRKRLAKTNISALFSKSEGSGGSPDTVKSNGKKREYSNVSTALFHKNRANAQVRIERRIHKIAQELRLIGQTTNVDETGGRVFQRVPNG